MEWKPGGVLGPEWEESVYVRCPGCDRSVQMNPDFVRGKLHRMRCMRCGHRGAKVTRVHTRVAGDRSNVAPISRPVVE